MVLHPAYFGKKWEANVLHLKNAKLSNVTFEKERASAKIINKYN